MEGLGYNYRIDEIRSALGRAQLAKLSRNNELRREKTALYHELLGELCPQVGLPFQEHPGISAAHLLPVLLPEGIQRQACMEALKLRGIQTSIHYPPVHQFSAFQGMPASSAFDLHQTQALAARELTLPLYPVLSGGRPALCGRVTAPGVGGESGRVESVTAGFDRSGQRCSSALYSVSAQSTALLNQRVILAATTWKSLSLVCVTRVQKSPDFCNNDRGY